MDPMTIISLVAFLLPKVVQMIGYVEQMFDGQEKSGETKKALVMGAAETITAGFAGLSTGGAKESWEKLKPLVDDFVEKAVAVAFAK